MRAVRAVGRMRCVLSVTGWRGHAAVAIVVKIGLVVPVLRVHQRLFENASRKQHDERGFNDAFFGDLSFLQSQTHLF